MMCLTRKGAGPGTPFTQDAPNALREALKRFDFQAGAAAALKEVLALARDTDGVTLWHLLGRTKGEQCGEVFDTLARLSPPPQGVTREGVIAGDQAMLRNWGSALGIGRM